MVPEHARCANCQGSQPDQEVDGCYVHSDHKVCLEWAHDLAEWDRKYDK